MVISVSWKWDLVGMFEIGMLQFHGKAQVYYHNRNTLMCLVGSSWCTFLSCRWNNCSLSTAPQVLWAYHRTFLFLMITDALWGIFQPRPFMTLPCEKDTKGQIVHLGFWDVRITKSSIWPKPTATASTTDISWVLAPALCPGILEGKTGCIWWDTFCSTPSLYDNCTWPSLMFSFVLI